MTFATFTPEEQKQQILELLYLEATSAEKGSERVSALSQLAKISGLMKDNVQLEVKTPKYKNLSDLYDSFESEKEPENGG